MQLTSELDNEREPLHQSDVASDLEGDSSNDLFKSILATVSTESIDKLRRGLRKQTTYWSGVGWVAEALEQRIKGIRASEIDLARVTENLPIVESAPNAGRT